MAKRPQGDAGSRTTPDQVEQHLRTDGSYEETGAPVDENGEPLAPGVADQQREGVFTDTADLAGGEALTPDMLEQRQVVEYDEEDDRPAE